MDKLRMRFSKTSRAIYISHLDLMHTLQRAFSRAGYELKYSEGYNPHPIISIALPLSVGTSSVCEILDFKLKGDMDLAEFSSRLTSALPEGIEVIEVYEGERKCAEIKWLKVSGVFEYDERPAEDILPELIKFFAQENIIISKKSKRGISDTDIRPMIKEIEFALSNDNSISVNALISAQEPTMNPELIADALRQKMSALAPDFAKFTRLETYDASMRIFR